MHIVNFKYKYLKEKNCIVITSWEKTTGVHLFHIHALSIFLVKLINKYIFSS